MVALVEATAYRARVLHSPAGQAAHEFTIPFATHELELYILKMAHPRRTVRSLNTLEGQTAREFGERLFTAVFQGTTSFTLSATAGLSGAAGRGCSIWRMRRVALIPLYSADLSPVTGAMARYLN